MLRSLGFTKALGKLWLRNDPVKVLVVVKQGVSKIGELRIWNVVRASSHHDLIWTEVNVKPGRSPVLPAVGRNDRSPIHFVRRLILTESDVPIDPKNGVFRFQPKGIVVLSTALNHLSNEVFKRFLYVIFVTFAVRIKPLLVVVVGQFAEKIEEVRREMSHSRFNYMCQFKQIALVLFVSIGLYTHGQEPVQTTELAFSIDLIDELPEALAFDPVDSLWYFGMVKTGKVYRYDPATGKKSVFLGADQDRRAGVFSLEIDADRRVLYVLSSPIPAFHGDGPRPCTIYEYHLRTGVLLQRNDFYDPDERRLLGDMERYGDGTLFISDSYYPAILKRTPDNQLEEFVFRPDLFRSLQGLALDDSTGILYAADYSKGLFAIDIFTGEILADTASFGDFSLRGIDGLALYVAPDGRRLLYAVQNGTQPKRLIGVGLRPDGRDFTHFGVIDEGSFPIGEPTNGVFIGSNFYFIANSPWPYFDQDGAPLDHEVWQKELEIRTLEIKP